MNGSFRERVSRRRALKLGAAAGVAALNLAALAGCGQKEDVEAAKPAAVEKLETQEAAEKAATAASAKPQQVALEVTFPANTAGAGKLMTDVVIPRYKKSYPNVTVKYEGTAWSKNQEKLMKRIAAGTPPDVFLHEDVILPSLSARDAILILDEYWKRDAEQLKNVVGEKSATDQRLGRRFGLARNSIESAMVYNRQAFEQAGVESPTNDNPWTWQEWLKNMKKLTWDKQKRSPDDSGFDPENVEQWGYWSRHDDMAVGWAPWILQNGGQLLDEKARKSTLDTAYVTKAMEFVNDATWTYHVSPTPAQAAAAGKKYHELFLSGRCASMGAVLGQESQYPMPDKAKFEIKAMVHTKNKGRGVVHGSVQGVISSHHQMMIAKGSKVADEAWAFLLFQATDEESSKGVFTLAHDGLPADKRYWKSPEVLRRDVYPKAIDAFLDPIEKGYAYELWPNVAWPEWHQAIAAAFAEFSNNRVSVEEGVKRAQKASQEILDSAYQKLGG